MWRFIVFAFLPGLAFADSVETEAQGCMYASSSVELRNCLSDVFYRRGFELDERIASVSSSLNDAGGLKADVMAAKFESEMTAWRLETDERCDRDDIVARELCRLSALETQERELSRDLDFAMREFGGY